MTIKLDCLFEVFANALDIPLAQVSDDLKYNSIPKWDSISHMSLVVALEDKFQVMLDTDDIIDMSSVGKAKEILAKYDVVFE